MADDVEIDDAGFSCLQRGGEMGALMRAHDWSRTAVGPVESWPQSLRTAVRILLNSRYPMFIWWGPELTNLYNDAYIPILGKRHPDALGRSAPRIWDDIWETVGPQANKVLDDGEATWNERTLLVMERYGYTEETYFTFSYSPVTDDDGRISGVFCACTEETERVIAERRMQTLRDLATRTVVAEDGEEACRISADVLAGNGYDVPFALIYLLDGRRPVARLAASTGVTLGSIGHPNEIEIAGDDAPAPWPLAAAPEGSGGVLVEEPGERVRWLTGGPWPEAPSSALILPITNPGQERRAGFLIAGISPRRAFDESYRGFFDLVAGQIASAVSNAQAYEHERRRAEALAELDRSKTAFFSNVSHEFRTPLTLILGLIEELLDRPRSSLEPDDRNQVEVVRRNSLRLLKLVNALLDFSRIEAGRAEAAYCPTDLAQLTENLASVFRSAVERAGIRFVVDCPALPEAVYVDREMWEKIVFNLLSNALKFTFGGEITVRLTMAEDRVELEVRDTGTGIPETELPNIFDRFHRVPGARSRTHEGSGIGLSLVRELVRLHGGEITVTSTMGEGSSFVVSIPRGSKHLPKERIEEAHPSAEAPHDGDVFVADALGWLPPGEESHSMVAEQPPRGGDAKTARILLADDNADMRDYLSQILRGRWTVEAVADGAAALEAARDRVPDLVLADVMMPQMDGFELIAQLRADPRTSDVPVILVSARAGEESRVEGLDMGADDYLVKPFSTRELMARVDTRLKIARAHQESIRREETLRASEARFRALFEGAPDAVFIADAEGVYRDVNPSACRLTGYPRDELIGMSIPDLIPLNELARLAETKARMLAGEAHVGEWTFRRKDGTVIPVEVSTTILPDGRWQAFVRDITDRRKAQNDLTRSLAREQDARRQAEQANRLKDEFLAVVSHELRTPLNAILGWSRLVRSGIEADMLAHGLEVIERNARFQAQLIEDLLDMSRIITGKLRLDVKNVDLEAIVSAALDVVRPAAGAKKIDVLSTIDAGLPQVLGDPNRLQQIVWNLLSNAVKFTPEGGRVDVSVSAVDASIEIEVRDTGRGVDVEFLPYVFDRFSQADSSVKREHRGLGLGLAIVRHLTEMHGGTVHATSDGAGRGATFVVRLPLHHTARDSVDGETNGLSETDPGRAGDEPAAPGETLLSGVRALVVDDDDDARDLIRIVLARQGAEIREFRSVTEALESLEGWRPNLLITDIGMPERDGYEMIQEIHNRTLEDADAIPAIAVTAYASDADRKRIREAGFRGYLAKPIDPETFVRIVAGIVQGEDLEGDL